jgi:FecR protein
MKTSLSIQRTSLLLALASAYPVGVLANAGTAQFSIGDVSVQRAAATAPLSSGGGIESGDLITTGTTGRTQLRFTDGGMVSLQPNSQFKITKYADAGDGKQDSFLVDLARGGMRALTGLIGKRNRDNYKVTTSTATIGIRGSGFSAAYRPDGTLGVTTEQDAIEVCTQAGCIGLNLGESAIVSNAQTLPTRTRERASWNPPEPRRLITARNDDINAIGTALAVPPRPVANTTPIATPPNPIIEDPIVEVSLAYAGAGINGSAAADNRLYAEGLASFAGNNFLSYAAQSGEQATLGTTTILESNGTAAGGDLLILGTWQNSVWSLGNMDTPVSPAAFVMGSVTPVPQAGVAALFPSSASYSKDSATPVFSSSGAVGTLSSASIFINSFSVPTININLQVDFAASGPIQAETYFIAGGGTLTNTTFSVPLSTLPASCSAGCNTSGLANGFFVGPTAGRVGLSYITNTAFHALIGGAATFSLTPE